jgi:hypothetical protein
MNTKHAFVASTVMVIGIFGTVTACGSTEHDTTSHGPATSHVTHDNTPSPTVSSGIDTTGAAEHRAHQRRHPGCFGKAGQFSRATGEPCAPR